MLFISVIIPVFNRRKYIRRCIDSILKQSFTDYEVIVVDDGSYDGTGKICGEYARKFEKVKVIHQQNGGVSKARNRGIAAAEGKYITFIDSDDYILPDYLQKIKDAHDRYGDEFLYCTSFQVHTEDGIRYYQHRKTADYTIIKGNLFSKLIAEGLFNTVINKVYCLKPVRENLIKFPEDVSLGEDLIFNLRYLDKQKEIQFLLLNRNYYHQWRKKRNSTLESDWRNNYFEIQKLLLEEKIKYFNKWVDEGKIPSDMKSNFSAWYFICIRESVEHYFTYLRKKGPVQITRQIWKIRRSPEFMKCVQLNGAKKGLLFRILYDVYKKQRQEAGMRKRRDHRK